MSNAASASTTVTQTAAAPASVAASSPGREALAESRARSGSDPRRLSSNSRQQEREAYDLSKLGTSTEIDAILTHYKRDNTTPTLSTSAEPDVSKKSGEKKSLRFSEKPVASDGSAAASGPAPAAIAQSIMRKKGQNTTPTATAGDDFIVVDAASSSVMPGSVATMPTSSADALGIEDSFELSMKPSASTADISEFLKIQRQRTVSTMKNAQLEREVAALEQQLKQLEQLDTGIANAPIVSSAHVAVVPTSIVDGAQKASVQKSGLSLIRNARTKLGGLTIPQAVKPSPATIAADLHDTPAHIAAVLAMDNAKKLEKNPSSGRLRRETYTEQSSTSHSSAVAAATAKLAKDDTAHRRGQVERLGNEGSAKAQFDSSKLANLKAGSSRSLARANPSLDAVKVVSARTKEKAISVDPLATPLVRDESFQASPGNRSPSPPPPPMGDPNTEHEGDDAYSSDGFESPFEAEVPSTAMRKERDYGNFAEAKQSTQSHSHHAENMSSKRSNYGSDSDSVDEGGGRRRRPGREVMKFQQLPHSVAPRSHHRHHHRSDSSAVDSDSDASLDFDGLHGGSTHRYKGGDESSSSIANLQKSPPLAAVGARDQLDAGGELRPVKGIPSNGMAYLAKIKHHASSRLKTNRSKELLADEKKSAMLGADAKRMLEPMGSAANLGPGGVQQLPGLDAPLLLPRGTSLSPLVPGGALSEETSGLLSNPGLIGGRTSPTPRLDVGHVPSYPASLAPLVGPKIIGDVDQSSKSVALPLMLLKEKGRSNTMKPRRGPRHADDGSDGNTTLPSASNSAMSSPRDEDAYNRHMHEGAGSVTGSPEATFVAADAYPPKAETKPSRGTMNPVHLHRSGGRSAKISHHNDEHPSSAMAAGAAEESSADEGGPNVLISSVAHGHTSSPGIAYNEGGSGAGGVTFASQQQAAAGIFSNAPVSSDIKAVKQKSNRKFQRASSDDFHRHIEASRMRQQHEHHSQSVKTSSHPEGVEEQQAGIENAGAHHQRPWSQTMNMRMGEVEFVLRKPVCNDDDIKRVLVASEAGLCFMDELNSVSKSLKLSRGALSRWLLPYDHNTRIDEQSSNVAAVIDSMPDFLVGRISDKQVQYLVAGLNGVRKLVRIKIADDNDLEQARTGLKLLSVFFQRLTDEAKEQEMSPYALLESRKG